MTASRLAIKVSPELLHPEGNILLSAKFLGNPSNGCGDISIWTKVMDQPPNISIQKQTNKQNKNNRIQ